jgi:phosphatidylserine decarboxylase
LDVYGENIRVVVPIDTEVFGRVMVVCVGAMMVGSTVITAKKGQKVRRTDELGYFKFGAPSFRKMLIACRWEYGNPFISTWDIGF